MRKQYMYRSSPIDPNKIRIISNTGYVSTIEDKSNDDIVLSNSELILGSDWQKEISEDISEDLQDIESNTSENSTKSNEWFSSEINGTRRIVSSGDLRYNIGDLVLILLPYYFDKSKPVQYFIITGHIRKMITANVADLDIPRETKIFVRKKIKKSKENYPDCKWKEQLTINNWKEPITNDIIQTMVTKYTIEITDDYLLSDVEIRKLQEFIKENSTIPSEYNLNFRNSDTETPIKSKNNNSGVKCKFIDVDYRYVMGTLTNCYKHLSAIKNAKIETLSIVDLQEYVRTFKLHSGVFARYYDDDDYTEQKLGDVYNFMIVDHICSSPLEIKFVIRPSSSYNRIICISDLTCFHVRNAYPTKGLKLFSPVDRSFYTIMNPTINSADELKQIQAIIKEIFDPIKVYTVKKSLCNASDIQSKIYEDSYGNVIILPSKGLDSQNASSNKSTYSGISLISYVKGLAYPEGNPPLESNSYIFFQSKDYHELVLDPDNGNFLNFVPTTDKHMLYRNPSCNDIILAVPFICNRDQFKGKTNLKWFYPTNEFRLLHLYITSNGKHNHFVNSKSMFKNKSKLDNISQIRSMFNGNVLCLFDLYVYGLSKKNQTVNSEFTKMFISKYFWWEKLRRNSSNST